MTDPIMWTAVSGASLAGIVVVSIAALKGWRDWINLQRFSLEGRGTEPSSGVPSSAARIARRNRLWTNLGRSAICFVTPA